MSLYKNILNIALLMKDETIYFPTFLDFRGRIYPTPNYLNYQSSDLARSLLLFKEIDNNTEGKSLIRSLLYKHTKDEENNLLESYYLNEEMAYVKIYLANVFGKSKLSREERINWFEENISEMLELYESNKEMFINTYISTCKEPYQFMSCFLGYYHFLKDGTEINNPILFDASCSGIQHLSALTSDTEIGHLVNLLPNKMNEEEPSDFYTHCINLLLKTIQEIPESDKLFKEKLLSLKFDRKILKVIIMTIPYNVTNIGISDKLIENFKYIFKK